MFSVEFYETARGDRPAEDFILAQDPKMQAKIFEAIMLLKVMGSGLRGPTSKYLSDGIFELRAQSGSNAARVLYFFVVGQRIIVTNGFMKKTQKTPISEIETAKRYRADYLSRKG